MLESLKWRLIGPHRAGRVVAVAGDPRDPLVFYFGGVSGGVFKTISGGQQWQNVSDGFFRTSSVGALAVSVKDPNVIYAGMGEACIRGNVTHGDGVYRSTDGGTTWSHVGLADTRHIGRVRIHPDDPDTVYVAALGHIFGTNEERGVFRSRDGGKTWQQVLSRGDQAGAIDLAMDPMNPRILYAAFWEASRSPYSLTSGGPGSGLFKSIDGGDSWQDLTHQKGLPEGVLGRIGITVSAQPQRLYASVEAEEGGIFRSDDAGHSWQRLNEDRELRQRAWYYSHIFADPKDADTVYVLNVQCFRSVDGGRTFAAIATPHGDNHDLWIDPQNPLRMIEGNDGGAIVSYDAGRTFTTPLNQATAQFYHVTTDTRFPYRVYGAQQDNSTITVPSRSSDAAITMSDAYAVGGGESGYIAVRPDNPDIVFAGSYGLLTRYDHRTRQSRVITPWPEQSIGWAAKDLKYRFQWTFPIHLSPHDPNVLYAAANVVFRSLDEGSSWEVLSPDLTRQDESTMGPSGGPITKDNTSVEYYGTVFALAESPLQKGLLWAGSDDGLIHVSRDGGAHWQDVTPKNLPEWSLISIIEPSPHDAACAYVAATRYKHDDLRPYLLRTRDYGASWQPITEGIPAHDFTRVVRCDPVGRGLLFAGTESCVYVSYDDGDHWQSLQLNLPVVPVHDLVLKDDDLVAGTHGRSFWILDDIGPLRQRAQAEGAKRAHLFQPRTTVRMMISWGFNSREGKSGYQSAVNAIPSWIKVPQEDGPDVMHFLDAGDNLPSGVIVTYLLQEEPKEDIRLAFMDAQGQLIRSFTSAEEKPKGKGPARPRLSRKPGSHRFLWDMRAEEAHSLEGAVIWGGGTAGPLVPPGSYDVRLDVDGETLSQSFAIVRDPRLAVGDDDLKDQYAFLMEVRDALSEAHDAIADIRAVREQVDHWLSRAKALPGEQELKEAADTLKADLATIEESLIQVRCKSSQDVLNYPCMLNNKIASLARSAAVADNRPTRQDQELLKDLKARSAAELGRLKVVMADKLEGFAQQLRALDLPPIVVPSNKAGH